MAARHRQVRRYVNQRVSAEDITAAAAGAGLDVVRAGATGVQLKARMNLASFGERIDVALTDMDGGTVVDVTSRCALPTQVIDWGRNRRNVRLLYVQLDRVLGLPEGSEQIRRCGRCDQVLIGVSGACCPECGADLETTAIVEERPRSVWGLAVKMLIGLTVIEVALFFWWRPRMAIFGLSEWEWLGALAVGVFAFNLVTILIMVGAGLATQRWQTRG